MDRLPNIAFNSYITNDNEDPDNNLPLITSRYYKVNAFVELLQNNLSQKNLNSFSVMHSNIRSLSKNLHLLKDFLIMTESKFSIIGISETKLNDNSVINIELPNYKFIKENSPTQAGGVGMYIHKTIDFKVRSDLNLNIEGCECLWIEILNMYDEKNPIVGVVYRHPHSSFVDFHEAMSQQLEKVSNEKRKLIIMGDINIDLIKYESHQPTSEYMDMLYSNLCFPVITQPTRITDYTRTLIDHMYTNALDKCITAGICLTDISDHFPIFLIIEEMKILDRSKKKL